MILEEKGLIIDKLLEFAKKGKLNDDQKKKILGIVESLNKATETQKERLWIE